MADGEEDHNRYYSLKDSNSHRDHDGQAVKTEGISHETPGAASAVKTVYINRAPVLHLWVAIVGTVKGFDWDVSGAKT
jgi:hypothetical protein